MTCTLNENLSPAQAILFTSAGHDAIRLSTKASVVAAAKRVLSLLSPMSQ